MSSPGPEERRRAREARRRQKRAPRPAPTATSGGSLLSAFGKLEREQRRVVFAAVVLLATMFLPWYSRNYAATGPKGNLQTANDPTSAIGVFSFVEAAIFLVAVGVTLLMLARADGRPFHLPGGDGTIVTFAGAWAGFLVFYRFVDQPGGGVSDKLAFDYDLHWGIFFGFLGAAFLAYSGNALRAAELGEPPLPGDHAPTTAPPAVPEREYPEPAPGDHARRRVQADAAPTVVTPRTSAGRRRTEPEQESLFDDGADHGTAQPADDEPTDVTRRLPFEQASAFEDEPPEFPRR